MGGDPQTQPAGESTGSMLEAYTQYFPELMKISSQNILPTELAKVEASKQTAPGYAQLQKQLYDDYGPLMADTANRIASQQAKSQAQTDLDILRGTGKDLVSAGVDAQKVADPEYYGTRSRVSSGLGQLMDSIDLSGKASGGETEEMNRALAQEGSRRGTLNTPSMTEALGNALTFGQAQTARQDKAKGQLGAAIGLGTGFLPAAQSGVDAFKVATGKTSMPNAGDSKFQGVNQGIGSETFGAGNNFFNNLSSIKQTEMDINSKRRDSLDRVNEVIGSTSSLIGSL
jgi:hypothetical protein